MDSFASNLLQLTDSFKQARHHLLLSLTEGETLMKLSMKLDSLQKELGSVRKLIDKEKLDLLEFKKVLSPFSLNEQKSMTRKRVGFATVHAHDHAHAHDHDHDHLSRLSQDEFDSIPQYLRGRIPLTRINSFVDDFNRLLVEKYALLRGKVNPVKMTIEQRQRISEWRAAESPETENKLFLTETDLKFKSSTSNGHFKFDQVARNILTILRQVGRLKESRSSGIIRYIYNN